MNLEIILIELRNQVETFAYQDEDFFNHFDYNFSRFCANMSYLVYLKLKNLGFNNVKFVTSKEHAFVLMEDKIIDLTATQYFPLQEFRILILDFNDFIDQQFLIQHNEYKIEKICSNEYEIENSLIYWPKEQNCFYFKEKSLWYKDIIKEINLNNNIITKIKQEEIFYEKQ